MDHFKKQSVPFVVPTSDGKRIEEHFGRASIPAGGCSVAHMTAPPGWSEPHQTPEFDEITMVVRGKKRVEIDASVIDLTAGESIFVARGTRVRYSNPFDVEVEYWSVCIPAFALDLAHREDLP